MNNIPANTDSQQTSVTLLGRLWANEPAAWKRLSELYGPTVYGWCRAAGLPPEDSADVTQNVFLELYKGLTGFRRDRPGDRFSKWLWVVTRHRVIDHIRKMRSVSLGTGGSEAYQQLQHLPDPIISMEPDSTTEETETSQLVRRALELVRAEFEPKTWQACWRTTVEGQVVADVAQTLKMTAGAVYVARSRVLKRIREELEGLVLVPLTLGPSTELKSSNRPDE